MEKKSFYVLNWDFNSDNLVHYDILPYFRECYKGLSKGKRPVTIDEWKEFVKRSKLKPNLDGKKVVLKLLKNGYRYLLRKSARLYSLIVSQNSKKWEDLSDFEKMEYNRSISARKIKN